MGGMGEMGRKRFLSRILPIPAFPPVLALPRVLPFQPLPPVLPVLTPPESRE
jgi:hypothetical protein